MSLKLPVRFTAYPPTDGWPPVDSEARKPLIKTLYGEKMFAVDADAELTHLQIETNSATKMVR